MIIKAVKPISNGSRHKKIILVKNRKKFKPLIQKIHNSVGKNIQGRIVSRFKSVGKKKLYRLVDFFYKKYNFIYNFVGFEKTRYFTGCLALVKSQNNFYKYILAPDGADEATKFKTTFNFIDKVVSVGSTIPVG